MPSEEYLTSAEVYNSIKQLPESDDLTTAINQYIEEETAMVNGLLAKRYQLPILMEEKTREARMLIRCIIIYKVLTRVEMFLNLSGNGEEAQAVTDRMTYWKMYKESLNRILANKIILQNVPLVQTFVASSFPKPRFNREYDQW